MSFCLFEWLFVREVKKIDYQENVQMKNKKEEENIQKDTITALLLPLYEKK